MKIVLIAILLLTGCGKSDAKKQYDAEVDRMKVIKAGCKKIGTSYIRTLNSRSLGGLYQCPDGTINLISGSFEL